MKKETYYIISSNEDGVYLHKMTKEELEKDLNSEPGDNYIEKDRIIFNSDKIDL